MERVWQRERRWHHAARQRWKYRVNPCRR